MTKWLICPAPPRSGTTYLFRSLAAPVNARFFQAPHEKEVHWLQRGNPDKLDAMFGPPVGDRFYLDFSPGYVLRPAPFWKLASQLPVDGSVKFVIPLRDPIDQTFAHYLHDLKAHVTQESRPDISYPFFSNQAMARYFGDRSTIFGDIVNRFGSDNVLFLNFHRMFDDIADTAKAIARLLEVDEITLLPQSVGGGGWLPQFVYGGERGVDYLHGHIMLTVPARVLALLNGPQSRIYRDVAEGDAERIIARATSWQGSLNAFVISMLEKHVYARTIEVFSDLLGESISAYRRNILRATLAPVPSEILAALKPKESLADQVARGVKMASG